MALDQLTKQTYVLLTSICLPENLANHLVVLYLLGLVSEVFHNHFLGVLVKLRCKLFELSPLFISLG